MIAGILNFLIHWITLSQLSQLPSSPLYSTQSNFRYSDTVPRYAQPGDANQMNQRYPEGPMTYHTSFPSNPTNAPYQSFQFTQTNNDYQKSTLSFDSHWSLLTKLQSLSEGEIELFLPQILNLLVERDSLTDYRVFYKFENILINKCKECLPFGIRLRNILKVSHSL